MLKLCRKNILKAIRKNIPKAIRFPPIFRHNSVCQKHTESPIQMAFGISEMQPNSDRFVTVRPVFIFREKLFVTDVMVSRVPVIAEFKCVTGNCDEGESNASRSRGAVMIIRRAQEIKKTSSRNSMRKKPITSVSSFFHCAHH